MLTLALFQQLRGVESERSSLREVERFFAHLFPGVVGLWPSSLNRRSRKLRRFLEPLRRAVVPELVGDPETLVVDSTLLEVLHPRQVEQLHLLCATNRVPVSYELTPANVAEVRLVGEPLDEAGLPEDGAARRLSGDVAYRSGPLKEEPTRRGVLLRTGEAGARRPGERQQVEVAFSVLKRTFGLGRTSAKTLVGLVSRIAAKLTAHAYGCYVNRLLGRPQGRIKDLWA